MADQTNFLNLTPEYKSLFSSLQKVAHQESSPKWREPLANESSFCGQRVFGEYCLNYEFGKSEIHGGWVLHLLVTVGEREVFLATGRGQGDGLAEPESISVCRADRLEISSLNQSLEAH
ncbi:hypothetical protein EBR25_03825 [bacterium]|nr:hypothetical protein [bacterium]